MGFLVALASSRAWPSPFDAKGRVLAALGIVSFIAVFYVVPMHLHFVRPTPLVPTAVDRAVPFLEWTIWIYVSYFVILFVPFVVCRDEARVMRVLRALALNSVLAGAVFLAWPTQLAVQQPSGEGLTGLLWRALLTVDRPSNCVPSLHVANACVCAFVLRDEGIAWRYSAPVWLALIVLSTLTTKQHYFIDIAAGVLLATFSFWWVAQPTALSSAR
jgi:membrane-associated phospholipid phosphatase